MVAIELTEPPSMYSQPVGRVTEVLGEIDDPGMEIEIAVRKYEVPHRFSPEALAQAAALPDRVRRPTGATASTSPTCRWSRSTARTRATSTMRCTANPLKRARQDRGRRLAAGGRDRRRQPLREARRAARRRRLRARHLGVLPAPRDSDAAGEALQRPVLAEPRGRPAVHGVRHARHRRRRDPGLPVLPGHDVLAGALHLHRGGGHPGQHARPRGRSGARTWCRTCSTCTRSTARC